MVLLAGAVWTTTDDDGTGQFGSIWNKAWVDAVKASIEAAIHSATNPTITPGAIIDEVVTARGSMPTLDARLDVVLNEDGTLKTQASLVTVSQVQSGLGSRNVAINGDLDVWTLGGALAPDSFTLTGAAATIARTGIAQADTFHFGTGSGFAARITRAGTNWKLTQDIIATVDFAKYVNVKGQKVSVAVKGKTSVASYLRIVVDDGVTQTTGGATGNGTFHTGGGAEEHLYCTHTISASATKLSVYVEGIGSNGDGYVGGFVFVFADLAPSDWQALSRESDASATVRGLWSIGTQVLPGDKTFTGTELFSGRVKVTKWKPLADDFTDHATSGTGPTDVWSVSVPGGTLANGETLIVESMGDQTGDTNAKTYLFTLGATAIGLGSSPTGNFTAYKWRLTLTRVSASVQRAFVELIEGLVGIAGNYVALTENMDNTLTLKITLTHAVAGTTTQRAVRSRVEPAA